MDSIFRKLKCGLQTMLITRIKQSSWCRPQGALAARMNSNLVGNTKCKRRDRFQLSSAQRCTFASVTRVEKPGNTLEDRWRSTTARILDHQIHGIGSFDTLLWQTSQTLLLWWVERGPEGVDVSLKILDRMVDEAASNRADFRLEPYVIHSLLQNWKQAFRGFKTNILPSSLVDRIDGYLQKSNCFEPNIATYTIILDGASYCPMPDERLVFTENLLRRLVEKSAKNPELRPTVVTFGSVANCFAQSGKFGDAEKAEALLRELQRLHSEVDGWQDVEPNAIIYTAVINGWAKAGSAKKAEALLREMYEQSSLHGKHSLQPNRRTFNTVLAAWSRNSSPAAFDSAEALLRLMQNLHDRGRLDTSPDTVSYNCLLALLARRRKDNNEITVAKAESLLKEIIEASPIQNGTSITPDRRTFTSIIKIIAWSNLDVSDRLQKAHEIVHLMNENEIPITPFISSQVGMLEQEFRSLLDP